MKILSLRSAGLAAGLMLGSLLMGAAAPARPEIKLVADEADAALAILRERKAGGVRPESWQKLWDSAGYRRLAARDKQIAGQDDQQPLHDYLLSDATLAKLPALEKAVADIKAADFGVPAARTFYYLPAGFALRATLYAVVKPTRNSFIYDLNGDPAFFIAVNPERSAAKLVNTVAHELHHVGLAQCADPSKDPRLDPRQQRVVDWLSGFGEGEAMLAAAGGPDVHPHASSPASDWLVWERDVADFDTDLPRMQAFFRAILDGTLTDDQQHQQLDAFIESDGVPQGPFYTVGWKMAAIVERIEGHEALVGALCDPRRLLALYNQAVADTHRGDGGNLPTWDASFLAALQPAATQAN